MAELFLTDTDQIWIAIQAQGIKYGLSEIIQWLLTILLQTRSAPDQVSLFKMEFWEKQTTLLRITCGEIFIIIFYLSLSSFLQLFILLFFAIADAFLIEITCIIFRQSLSTGKMGTLLFDIICMRTSRRWPLISFSLEKKSCYKTTPFDGLI